MKILDIYKNPLYTLYQWDVNQFVNVVGINPEMPVSVQFWRAGQTEAFVVESTVSGNTVTAAIPNELLRDTGELVIYIWQDTGTGEQKGGRTETFFNVPIKERAQPSDYIYDDNVEYISVKTVIEDAKKATTAAQEATEAATAAAQLATATAEDIKQRADSGEFNGEKGDKGDKGDTGQTPDISINATVNNSVGTPAVSIEKTGTLENPVFNLSFENLKGEQGVQGERGEQGVAGTNGIDGKSATIAIGTVTTVSPDTPASVTNTGTETDAVFNFGIPKGENGIPLEELEKIAIKTTIEGNPAMSGSSAEWRIPMIECYGKSTQGENPTPETPQEISYQNVTRLKISDGNGKEQIVNLSAPIILRGFPSEKGNVTIDGEMYLSDYIGQKEGVYGVFRKIQEITDNGEAAWSAYNTYQGFSAQLLKKSSSRLAGLCNQAKILANADIPITENTMWIGVGNAFVFFLKTNFYNAELPDKGRANWKEHLAENPLKIITVADEETFEPLPEADQQALKQIKTFYPTSIISWETEDGSGVWTRAEIVHDPANYIDEKISKAVTQAITLAQGGTI